MSQSAIVHQQTTTADSTCCRCLHQGRLLCLSLGFQIGLLFFLVLRGGRLPCSVCAMPAYDAWQGICPVSEIDNHHKAQTALWLRKQANTEVQC